jgi:iron-sulfur cluster repair protein YtfE (RIC family)
MVLLTQPLRDEHQELLPYVEQLRTVADGVGSAAVDSLRLGIDEVYEFLSRHLMPHAQAEESALYPVVQRVMGAPEATATMSRDHVEISRLTDDLGVLRTDLAGAPSDTALAPELRRVLYGLYTLVKVHFAKEEEVYLPLLDARLSEAEADDLFASMGHAAQRAKEMHAA